MRPEFRAGIADGVRPSLSGAALRPRVCFSGSSNAAIKKAMLYVGVFTEFLDRNDRASGDTRAVERVTASHKPISFRPMPDYGVRRIDV